MTSIKNSNLSKARSAKNDEFYTQMQDIEKELVFYKSCFKDKVVYLNCDSELSNFWKYFRDNFDSLGIKELIATHISGGVGLFGISSYKLHIFRENGVKQITKTYLVDNGDFRSDECVELLKYADIVVTNPPFSLFREFIDLLVKYNKQFLLLGNLNGSSYKNVFPLIMQNVIKLGPSIIHGSIEFAVPKSYPLNTVNSRIDDLGNKFIKVTSIRWFTNMEFAYKRKTIELTKVYDPEKYPKYDNFDAINVDAVSDIPKDYAGVMGVPVSFLDKYNPEQFEILGITKDLNCKLLTKKYSKCSYINNKKNIKRNYSANGSPSIKIDGPLENEAYYICDDEYLISRYNRILIRNIILGETDENAKK